MSQHTITGTPIVETLSNHTIDIRTPVLLSSPWKNVHEYLPHTHCRYMYVSHTVLCVAMKCVASGKAGHTVYDPSSFLPSGTFPVSPFGRDTLRKHLLRDKLCRMEFCKGCEERASMRAQLQGTIFSFMCTIPLESLIISTHWIQTHHALYNIHTGTAGWSSKAIPVTSHASHYLW